MKNLLFVDDEPNVLQGLKRQLYPLRNEWNMNFAEGGHKALDFMEKNPVDVIVTDMVMPGMDGSQLLTEVARRHSGTVRIVLSGHAEREAVLRLVGPAHQYISKPCEASELRNAIARAFALRDILCNTRLKELATQLKSLPSLPSLYQQLNEEFSKGEPSPERISEIVSHDIGMTSKILQLVNSAFFGLPQPISNPTEAVLHLGIVTVRSLVLTLQVFSQFDRKACPGFSLDALTHHCWMTGVAARRVAHQQRKEVRVQDQCFLAGLLHDVGQLILATGLHDEYQEVMHLAKTGNVSIWQVEQERFGASHADVGAYLLGVWGLPDPIIEAVAMHHQPALCILNEFSPVIAVHVADVFMHERPGANTESPPPPMDRDLLARLDLADHVETWRELCMGDLENLNGNPLETDE